MRLCVCKCVSICNIIDMLNLLQHEEGTTTTAFIIKASYNRANLQLNIFTCKFILLIYYNIKNKQMKLIKTPKEQS